MIRRFHLAALIALASIACQDVDPSRRTVDLDELRFQSLENGLWQSAEWDTPWLSFPGKQSVTIMHDLGTTPRLVQVYVAFAGDDCERDEPSSALLASGTLASISEVNATSVTVRNGTKENYCLRLVLQ